MKDAGRFGGTRGQTTLDFAVGITVFLITVAFVFTFIPGMLDPFTDGLEEETVASNRVADSLVLGTLGDPDEPYVLDRECTIAFFESPKNLGGDGADANDWDDGDGFFGGIYDDTVGGYDANNCNFADVPLRERVGLQGRPGVGLDIQIRLVRDTGETDPVEGDTIDDNDKKRNTLCVDANDGRIVENNPSYSHCDLTSNTDDDVLLSIGTGDPPSNSGSVVVARRTAYLEGGLADGTNDVILVLEVW